MHHHFGWHLLLLLDDGNHNINIILMSIKPSKALNRLNCWRYAYPALHKTSAGIRTPCKYKATPDAESVFFVVCYTHHSMAWCAHLMTNSPLAFDHATVHHAAHNGGICRSIRPVNEYIDKLSTEGIFRRQRMVTLAGLPKGRPVSSNAGTANPVNVTAPIKICSLGGDSLNLLEEAA
ncbi:TPA: ash family protein [Salmonella enterica]|nr:ash family protein [Salmonella enterica]